MPINPTSYTLYGAEVSLYSGKARAHLRFKQVPFIEVQATRRLIERVLYPAVGLRILPVLQTPDGTFVQDTTDILDHIEGAFPERSVYPSGPLQRMVALLFEVYGDEWLLLPAMHHRWAHRRANYPLVLGEFGAIVAPRVPRFLRPLAGLPLAVVFGGAYGEVLGIGRHNRAALEASYLGFLADFEAHLEAHPFLLGSRPSVGDFGLIGPLYAHLYRDPWPGELMRSRAPRVARWVQRMQNPGPKAGSFLPDDQVPETLIPLLQRFFEEFGPVAVDMMVKNAVWAARHPDAEHFPRFIGRQPFHIGGVASTRRATPYTQWMWQRPLDAYRQMTGEQRLRADAFLSRAGGADFMAERPGVRVARVDNRVVPVRQDAPAKQD